MKLKTLDEIGNIQTGTTPKTSEPENFGDYIPFIKPSDFNADGTLCLESCEYLSEIGIGKGRLIPKHSVLMTCIGSIGKCGYNDIDVSCNQQINALTPHTDNYKYIYYVMKSGEFQTRIQNICPKTVVPIINKTLWGKLEISLPSREEQDKIVSILDNADEIRAKKKLANDKLDEFLKSTFISMFGNKDYEKRCLEEISIRKGEYGSGASAGEYDISLPRYVRITDINDNGKLTSTPVSPKNEPNIDKYTLTTGDILFARSGATVGKTYLYNERDGWCIYAGYCIKFKLNQDIVNPNYIFIYTQMNEYKAWVKSKQKVVAQPNINAQQYGQELLIPIPPIEEQNKFAKIVEKVEAQKQKNEQVIEQMDNLFNSLSQRAFKGEL